MKHILKSWPEQFDAVLRRIKKFEIRKNDRGFAVGDELELREFDPHAGPIKKQNGQSTVPPERKGVYTGRTDLVRITYITHFGQMAGYVVMGIELPGADPLREAKALGVEFAASYVAQQEHIDDADYTAGRLMDFAAQIRRSEIQ